MVDLYKFASKYSVSTSKPSFRVFFFALFCCSPITGVDTAGHINFQIRKLVLTKALPGCCAKDSNDFRPIAAENLTSPAATGADSSSDVCMLNFRLCIGVSNFSSGVVHSRRDCLIVAANFTAALRTSCDSATHTFITSEPSAVQHFNFTSAAINSRHIFIELSVWSVEGSNKNKNNKLLLFSRQNTALDVYAQKPTALEYAAYGNKLAYQLQVKCASHFHGPKCATFCEPPLLDDHYNCTPRGMQCHDGWNGTRCSQPVCSRPCVNGGRCVGPEKCACPTGWEGDQCHKCKPKGGCQNGYCTDEPGKCMCLPNWTGPDCNLMVNKCLDRPCKNGGRCTTYGVHGNYFRCFCPPGFTGLDCAISYALCKNATCGPNQRCAPLENSYSCVCDSGFTGSDCRLRQAFGENNDRKAPTEYDSEKGRAIDRVDQINNTRSNASTSSPTPHLHLDSGEFSVVKALVCASFFLLLLILAILCCGPNAGNLHGFCYCLPCQKSKRRGGHEEELGQVAADELTEHSMRRNAFIRIQPRNGSARWDSCGSAAMHSTDEDELDSGVGSIHSTNYPLGPKSAAANNDSLQQKRLVSWAPATAQRHPPTVTSPPPSYEESLRTNNSSNQNQQTMTVLPTEAIV